MVKKISIFVVVVVVFIVNMKLGFAEPALTIYNQNFAVVRDELELNLKKGVNDIRVTEITAHMEPDSVILRDPTGKHDIQILEQNYHADPVSQGLLLSFYEGETIDFLVGEEIVRGKIIRSGYVPHRTGMQRYGHQYRQRQMAYAYDIIGQPIIEVDGKLRFGLPGIPLFPALSDDTILKPTLHWVLETNRTGKMTAELCYLTGGMSWEADYNMISPTKGDVLDIVGWVTMDNQCGRTFENAKIKLMAGDISKIKEDEKYGMVRGDISGEFGFGMRPPVTEKTFDEYHLYTLQRPTILRDRETKQVEFVRASGVKSQRLYIYDGAKIDEQRYRGWSMENIRGEHNYGTQCNSKVWIMREFKNSKSNNLGIPLPRGRMRFYRRDDDGQLEFTGENIIDHTPCNETVRVYTGNAFDLVGERKRTYYKIDTSNKWLDEAFEIKLRNHKKEDVEIRVVEHLYRWTDWEILKTNHDFEKVDSQKIEYRINIPKQQSATILYTVRYRW